MTRSGASSGRQSGGSAVIVHRSGWCEEKHGLAFVGPLIEAVIKKIAVGSGEKAPPEKERGG